MASSPPSLVNPGETTATTGPTAPTWTQVFNHIFGTLGEVPSDSPIRNALSRNGITALTNLVNLTYKEILSLDYQPTGRDRSVNPLPVTKLNLGNVNTLQLLGKFMSYTSEQYRSLELEDIMNLTENDYCDFPLTKAYQYIQTTTSVSSKVPTSTTGGAVASSTPQYFTLIAFQKSIK